MKIDHDYPLKRIHTFQVDATARYFAEVTTPEELVSYFSENHKKEWPLLILGGGSNVLFIQDFEGTVLKIGIKGREIIEDAADSVLIRANAGEHWDDLVKYCVDNGWGGLENLSLIPGNVGTCPVQNIGAYGVEIKDVIDSVEAFNIETLERRIFSADECELNYRDSVFKGKLKGKFIILNVSFRLNKNPLLSLDYANIRDELKQMNVDKPDIRNVREAIIRIRRRKLPDPAEIGNAGSFFKNPTVTEEAYFLLKSKFPNLVSYDQNGTYKIPAGWMIDQCGWKGKRFGDAGVHKDQALILVNYGNATGEQILNLSKLIRESVYEKFGILLEYEVNIIA